ncbi:hypothetical protein BH09MYX1_BH09MYX1_58490 [soil metagenome]
MQGFVLQNWFLARGSGTAPFVQDAKDWIAFSSFQDIVFHLEVKRLSATGATWNFQTAPTKDELLFKTMISSSSGAGLSVLPVLLSGSPAASLATWVRWSIAPGPNTSWEACFRVIVSANRVSSGIG